MVLKPFGSGPPPEPAVVLDALGDEKCRRIIQHLDVPQTADELSGSCDIPVSTVYRKLELLTDSSLVDDHLLLYAENPHTRRYSLDFESVELGLTPGNEFEVQIRRSASPDRQLASMWAQVSDEV